MERYLFSIITVCFNDKDNLVKTINSVQCQNLASQHEHIIIDGLSTDGTKSILSSLKVSRPLISQVILQKNREFHELIPIHNVAMEISVLSSKTIMA